jgi:S1-C subfamily serine protease
MPGEKRRSIMTARNVRARLLLACATLFAGLIAGSYATAKTGLSPFATSQIAAKASVTSRPASDHVSFTEGFSPIVKRTLPSVVNVASSKVVRVPQGPLVPFLSDPLFEQFFGDEFLRQWHVPREQRQRSLGSGVIVRSDGDILTNNHVVEGATDIRVFLAQTARSRAESSERIPKRTSPS